MNWALSSLLHGSRSTNLLNLQQWNVFDSFRNQSRFGGSFICDFGTNRGFPKQPPQFILKFKSGVTGELQIIKVSCVFTFNFCYQQIYFQRVYLRPVWDFSHRQLRSFLCFNHWDSVFHHRAYKLLKNSTLKTGLHLIQANKPGSQKSRIFNKQYL